jgi:hypothetical protein
LDVVDWNDFEPQAEKARPHDESLGLLGRGEADFLDNAQTAVLRVDAEAFACAKPVRGEIFAGSGLFRFAPRK